MFPNIFSYFTLFPKNVLEVLDKLKKINRIDNTFFFKVNHKDRNIENVSLTKKTKSFFALKIAYIF